jgi:hypothetical protein
MIAEALAAYAKTTARQFEGRQNTCGASEIGQCSRKVFFVKNAEDHAYDISVDADYGEAYGAALRGRLFEEFFWVPALRARYGDKLLYAGADQRTLVSGFLSATPDALLAGDANETVLECKTADPRIRLDGPKSEHAYQAIVQIGLFRELTEHRPEAAIISYTNASFLDDTVEFTVRFDPVVFENAKRRAAEIVTATAASDLKPDGWVSGGKECTYCPFTRACGLIRHAVPTTPIAEAPDPQFVAEIADLALEAKRRRGTAEAATAAQRDIENEIRERLRAKGLRRVDGDGVTVTWSPVKGRPSFDMKAIREAAEKLGLDLAEYERTGEPSDRLTIRVAGQSRTAPDLKMEQSENGK